MAGGSEEKLTGSSDRALLYLLKVKGIVQDKPEKYTELLEALNALKDGKTNLAGLTAKVKELFKDHHDQLIPGFNSFLPKGYEITLSPKEEIAMHLGMAQSIDCEIGQVNIGFQRNVHTYNVTLERFADQSAASMEQNALCYLKKVKATFQNKKKVKTTFQNKKKDIYSELLGVLFELNDHKITLEGLVAQWKDLLKDHPDLIAGLNTFLPEGYKITLSPENNSATLQLFGNECLMRYPGKLPNRTKLSNEYTSAKKSADEGSKEFSGDLLQDCLLVDTIGAKRPIEAASKTPQSKKLQTQEVLKSPQFKRPPRKHKPK